MIDPTAHSQIDREDRDRDSVDFLDHEADDAVSLSDSIVAKIETSRLKYLITPWGIAGMGLILLTNVFLSGAYLLNSSNQQTTRNLSEPGIASSQVKLPSSFPTNLNLTAEKPQSLNSKTLSTLVFPPNIAPTPKIAASASTNLSPTPAVTIPSNPDRVVQPATDLTKVLLPPSLRPELGQSTAAPLPSLPLSIANQPTQLPAPVPLSSPAGVAPSTKPVTAESQPSSDNEDVTTQFSQREFFDRQQQEELEAEKKASMGFNQRTRIKLQTIYNQNPENQPPQDPRELVEQLQQLENQGQ